jgi:FtsP/CotA-like multicopper oxidase with cupredoxin domain
MQVVPHPNGRTEFLGIKEITMQTNLRNTLKLSTILLLVLALLGSGLYRWNGAAASLPGTSCTAVGTAVTCNLWATTGSTTLPGGGATTIWGYAASNVSPSLPGPVLIVNQGDTVTVNLTNMLGEASGLLFQGQSLIPDTTGAPANGGTKTYTFTASKPGTYLYEASPLLPNAQHQVAMGMYGALVVRPATAGQAYNDLDGHTAFNEEALLVLSEIDKNLNDSVNPAAFDMRNYHPTYFLINGESYPNTDPISVTAGNKVLLRFVNAGLQAHSMSTLGLTQNVIAVDGSPFTFAHKLTADTIFTGQTSDVIVQTSAAAPDGTKYAIYDSAFILSNNTSSGFGGMLTFLTLTGGAVTPGDTVGPLTAGMTLSSYRVAGGVVTLSATISEQFSGNGTVEDAEYFIDATGTDGTGAHFTPTPTGSETVTVSASIDADALPTGNHTLYVHGQDNSGNWGAYSSVVLAVDKTAPAIIGAQLIPNPSDGMSVLLEASADDRSTGGSTVTGMSYTLDGGSAVAMTLDSSASTYFFTSTLSTSGEVPHTVSLVATDELGNVSAPLDIVLVVDNTGPSTNSVVASPGSTNGVNQMVNSSVAAVRVSANFQDAFSNISTAEGFIGTPGPDGTGFPFIAADGLFDELSETGYADIPLSTFWVLAPGTYTINVHAKDASGNWGDPVPVPVTVTAHP